MRRINYTNTFRLLCTWLLLCGVGFAVQGQTFLPPGVTATHTAVRDIINLIEDPNARENNLSTDKSWNKVNSWVQGQVPDKDAIVWLPGVDIENGDNWVLRASYTLIPAKKEATVKAIYHGGASAQLDMESGASIRFRNPEIDFVMSVPTSTTGNLNNRFGVSLLTLEDGVTNLPKPPAGGADYTPDPNRPDIPLPGGAVVKSVMQIMVRSGQKKAPFRMRYELTGSQAEKSLTLVRYNSRYNSKPVFIVNEKGEKVFSHYIAADSPEGWIPLITTVSKVVGKTTLEVNDDQVIEGDGVGPQYMYYLLVSSVGLYENVGTDQDFQRTIKVDAVNGNESAVDYILNGGTISLWKQEAGKSWMQGGPSGNGDDIKCTRLVEGSPQNITSFNEVTLSVPNACPYRTDFITELRLGIQQKVASKNIEIINVQDGLKLIPKSPSTSIGGLSDIKDILQMKFIPANLAGNVSRRDLYVARKRYVDITLRETETGFYSNAMRSTLFFVDADKTVLPLYLQSWKGVVREGKAELSWKLGVPQAAFHCGVERSVDGLVYEQVWTGLASVYTEDIPQQGAFYRLRMEGQNGSLLYSDPIFLTSDYKLVALRIWPNPTQGAISFQYTGQPHQEVILRLVNLQGRLISQQVARLSAQGLLSQQIQAPANGVYLLQVQSAHGAFSQKVIVQ